ASFPVRDPALDDARLSLDAARRNPQVAMYASTELNQAAAALRQADDLAATGGRYDDVHSLALLASQRASAAQDADARWLARRARLWTSSYRQPVAARSSACRSAAAAWLSSVDAYIAT